MSALPPRHRRTMLYCLAAALILGASACGDADGEGTELVPGSATSTTSDPSATSSPTDSGSSSGSGTESGSGPDTASGTSAASPVEPTESGPAGTASARPPQVVPAGSPVWAVYVAVAPVGESASLQPAVDRVEGAGYQPTTGALCEVAAYEPLGLDLAMQYESVTVFFADETDAGSFVQLVGEPIEGVVQVEVSACADGS